MRDGEKVHETYKYLNAMFMEFHAKALNMPLLNVTPLIKSGRTIMHCNILEKSCRMKNNDIL